MIVTAAQIVVLILLHVPDGEELTVAPGQITSLREAPDPRKDHYPSKANCLVSLTDGKAIAVAETCPHIRKLIEEKGKAPP
jgi:hypothetical protein